MAKVLVLELESHQIQLTNSQRRQLCSVSIFRHFLAMTSTPSPGGSETLPPSPSLTCAQSAKDKRYDRQLRLWGDHGQSALERARVCVINATATATEILKSLILPGLEVRLVVLAWPCSDKDMVG